MKCCILGLCKIREKTTISPSEFTLEADPGTTVIQEIVVTTNIGQDFIATLTLEVTPPAGGDTADIALLTTSAPVKAKSSTTIPVQIGVKAIATAGDYQLELCVQK
jgi:uncharacterized membrane protein